MFWMIIAAAVWVFILIFLRRGFWKLWSAAIWSVLLAYYLNNTFVSSGFYLFQDIYYPFHGIPLAYLFVSAGIGIILLHYLPEGKWWQLAYLILFAAVISGVELFLQKNGYLQYLQWSVYNSFIFRLLAFIALTWLSNLTIRRETSYFYR